MSERDIPPNQQVHMGNFHVTLTDAGNLVVHVWPANRLAISRSSYKDSRSVTISRVYPRGRNHPVTEAQP